MHGRRFCMRWIIRGWPGPSADGLGPRLAPNRPNKPIHNASFSETFIVCLLLKAKLLENFEKWSTMCKIHLYSPSGVAVIDQVNLYALKNTMHLNWLQRCSCSPSLWFCLCTGPAVLQNKFHFLPFNAEELLVQCCKSFVFAGMN